MTSRRGLFTLHGLVTAAADEHGRSAAVVATDGELTYEELHVLAGRVATALVEVGVKPGDRVAVAAERSTRTVAALYGIMRAGAAYVPIDPQAPPLRVATVVADAGCRAVCVDQRGATALGAALDRADAPILIAVGDGVADAVIDPAGLSSLEPQRVDRGCESDLAYILYTSGSTGTPKGVMLTHRNALAFVQWAVDRFAVASSDRLASHAPFHFDLSVFDLYGAASAGATLDLLTAAERSFGINMAEAIHRRRITVWYSVPSALVRLCDSATQAQLRTLRVILFAGEVFPTKHLRRLRAVAPEALLANLYGPTETNVCTYHVVDDLPADDQTLPIGKSCENQEIFALDDQLRPVDVDEVGELWVRGPTVMKGYWGDTERTARVLQQNPLHDQFDDPTFRTGDLVRRRKDNVFEFRGRRDHQVKVRGYRVELGEIETALHSHPSVREAVVVAVGDDRGETSLVAVVVVSEPTTEIELKRRCLERVPRYMVPGTVLVRDDLPHTSTGKVDRQAVASSVAATTRPAEA